MQLTSSSLVSHPKPSDSSPQWQIYTDSDCCHGNQQQSSDSQPEKNVWSESFLTGSLIMCWLWRRRVDRRWRLQRPTPRFHLIRVRCAVSPSRQRLIAFTLVSVFTSSRSVAYLLRTAGADTQDVYICRMSEHDAAIQLKLAPSRQEVQHRNNNITSSYFSK